MATNKEVLLLDTSIILDIVDPNRAGHVDAAALLMYASENPKSVELTCCVSSYKDAYYILTRLYKNEPDARDVVKQLMTCLVQPSDLLASYGANAIEGNEPNFEDGLIRECAENLDAAVIVTRDASAFEHSLIPHMDAAAYLSKKQFDYAVIDF